MFYYFNLDASKLFVQTKMQLIFVSTKKNDLIFVNSASLIKLRMAT